MTLDGAPQPCAVTQDRRGWNSEFAKPYKPLGVPKLDLAAPRDILRQRENVQKSFGQGARLPYALQAPTPLHAYDFLAFSLQPAMNASIQDGTLRLQMGGSQKRSTVCCCIATAQLAVK